jgi:hypothetical protein
MATKQWLGDVLARMDRVGNLMVMVTVIDTTVAAVGNGGDVAVAVAAMKIGHWLHVWWQ